MMRPPAPRHLASSRALLLAALALAGCATGLDADECRSADWKTIGYEDGLRGAAAERIGQHRSDCAKHRVVPDLAAYTAGREAGLQEYCQPRSGFRAGLSGQSYGQVCPATREAAFLDGYRAGRQIHDVRAELRSARSRLQTARSSLEQADAGVRAATAELAKPQVTTERRVALAQELVRLGEQRKELEARIERLAARVRDLEGDVRDLERRSPYPL